jgi:hypothetical protein
MMSGEDRNRTPHENTGKTGVSDQSGAECGALDAPKAPFDPELAAVVDAWPALPAAIKAGILAMIRGAK